MYNFQQFNHLTCDQWYLLSVIMDWWKVYMGLHMYDKRSPKALGKWGTKKFPQPPSCLDRRFLSEKVTTQSSRCPWFQLPCEAAVLSSCLILTLRWDNNSWWEVGLGAQWVCPTLSFPSPCILVYFTFPNTLPGVVIPGLNREFYLYRS